MPDTELAETVLEAAEGTPLNRNAADSSRLTIAQLGDNYSAIIRAGAIYSPVGYQFLRELGRGRQGVVFLGLRQGARGCITRHAIKLFDPSRYPSPELYWADMGRIAVQTSRLQSMQAPSLVARDSYEETYGVGYLQMEAIEGVDLKALLDSCHLECARSRSTCEEWARFTDVIFRIGGRNMCIQPGVAIYIIRMVLRGLEALNSMGFVHCDVKPGNIMVDRLGYVKLIDFGRAVSAGEQSSWLLGTPLYMAPEIHRRQPPMIQSDMFSAGLVCVEMLRGAPVCDPAADEAELLQIKLRLAHRLPDYLPAYVVRNERLVHILQRMLSPDPGQRFASVCEAESGPDGFHHVHKQLVQMGQDTEYGRELEHYLSKIVTCHSAEYHAHA